MNTNLNHDPLSQKGKVQIKDSFNVIIRWRNLANGDYGGTWTLIAFSGEDLVVESAEMQSQVGPSIEVIGGGDSSAGTFAGADRPVLLEGGGTRNRRLVGLGVGVDGVAGTIAGQGSNLGHSRARVVVAVVLKNVVLDQGARSPAVNSEIGISIGVEVSIEVNVPGVIG